MAHEPAPEHKCITPGEAARLMADEEGFDEEARDELAAQYRWHVLEYGPGEIEVGGTVYTVWIDDESEPGA